MNANAEERIVVDYKNGASYEELMRRYNLPFCKIYEAVYPCLSCKFEDVDRSVKDRIVSLYSDGLSSTKIGYMTGLYHKAVLRILKDMGVSRKKNTDYRTYSLNVNYFDEIDTPEKAYILGFIYADGYNNTDGGELSFALQCRDRDVLEKICRCLEYNGPISTCYYNHNKNKNNSVVSRLSINSIELSRALEKQGVMKNKSLKIEFPELRNDLYSHFMRGYFDGDGCFYYGGNSDSQISIASTESFCNSLCDYLHKNGVVSGGHVNNSCSTNGITKLFRIGGNKQVERILDWLYKDATIYLNRKYEKYLHFKSNRVIAA